MKYTLILALGFVLLTPWMACANPPDQVKDFTASLEDRVAEVVTVETEVPTVTNNIVEPTINTLPTATPVSAIPAQSIPVPTSTPKPIPTNTPTQLLPTPIPTPIWIPMNVEWERMTVDLKDDAKMIGYSNDQLPVIWVYHLFVITNPNDHTGEIRFFLQGVDNQGAKFEDDPYKIFVTSKVAPKSTAVIPTWNRIESTDKPIHDWLIDTEELDRCMALLNSSGIEDKCSVFVRTINGVTSGGSAWPAGVKTTPIHDPIRNDLFTLDGDWIVNKTNNTLELSYVCEFVSPLETLYETYGVTRIPDNLRPNFQTFPDIASTRIAYGKMVILKPGTKSKQSILSNDGQCGYWKVHQ